MTAFVETAAEAVAGIEDGATIMVSGFGTAGQPIALIDALVETGALRPDRRQQQRGQRRRGARPAH